MQQGFLHAPRVLTPCLRRAVLPGGSSMGHWEDRQLRVIPVGRGRPLNRCIFIAGLGPPCKKKLDPGPRRQVPPTAEPGIMVVEQVRSWA